MNTGRRRRWSDEAKRGIIAEAFESGISVSTTARRHGVDPSQIYDWRRTQLRRLPEYDRHVLERDDPTICESIFQGALRNAAHVPRGQQDAVRIQHILP